MNKILLPIDFQEVSPRVVHQAAFLARHFHSEILLLHVVTPFDYPVGVLESGHEITAKDLHAHIVERAQKDLDQALRPEFEGIAVKRLLLRGDPASEIVQAARDEQVSLIVMATHGVGMVYQFLMSSVTAKVLHESACPVWAVPHSDETPERDFAIRNILCAVDLSSHSPQTVSRAAQVAADFGARLTIVHITSSVESYGPGGSYVDPAWKETIVGIAAKEIAEIQQSLGTKADVIIESGDVHKLLHQVAERTQGDLLIVGHMPSGGHLGANGSGYSIIRDSHIPVLSI